MNNPDVEIEFQRNEQGDIIGLALKVNNDVEGKKTHRLCEIAAEAVRAEGPEDHSTNVVVDINTSDLL